MKPYRIFRQVALGLAVLGLCIPQIAFAETTTPKPVVNDVVLHQGGLLVGYVVSPENVVMGNVKVALYSKNKRLATGTTDQNGLFKFTGLKSGVYKVAVAKGEGTYRAWQQNIAPPAAEQSALVVNGTEIVRGQGPTTGLRIPLIIGGLVATAIAVPVAIHNSQSSQPVSGG